MEDIADNRARIQRMYQSADLAPEDLDCFDVAGWEQRCSDQL